MATLAGKTIADTYTSLLKLEGDTQTLVDRASGNAIQVKTGDDEATPLYLNTDAVGIGTNSPSKSLVIAGSGQQEIHLDAATNAYLLLDAGGNSDKSNVIFQKAGSTVGAIQYHHNATATSESLRIVVNESGSADPQMTVQADGKVGIGVSDPETTLDIRSTGTQLQLEYDDNNAVTFAVSSGGDLTIAPYGEDVTFDSINNFIMKSPSSATNNEPKLSLQSTFSNSGYAKSGPEINFTANHTDGYLADEQKIGEIKWISLKSDNSTTMTSAVLRVEAEEVHSTSTSSGGFRFLTTSSGNTSTTDGNQMSFTGKGWFGIGGDSFLPQATFSMLGGKHIIAVEQIIRFAHQTPETVIVEVPNVKIPAYAIITRVVAVVIEDSNLATHHVNIQMSATSGTSADSYVSSGTELLGAGAGADATSASTDEALGATRTDIHMDAGEDEKNVWISDAVVRNGASDQYIYVANAMNNGATNSTAGTLGIIIEYYGVD
jgi:hypothetical protein